MTEYFLEEIRKFARKKRVTHLERKRLGKDLEVVYDRLRKKEYQKGGFATNKFDVPDRTREFYIYLEFYCIVGKTWAALLKEFGINRFPEVVDLCPGYTPKIELALFYLNYRGKLIVIDKDVKAISELEKFMELFHPSYTLVKRSANLFAENRKTYDVVLANHAIDDFVIHYFAQKFSVSLRDIYETEGTFVGLWKRILKNKKQNLEEMEQVIVKMLESLVKKNGWLFAAHYKSYMERLLDMNEVAQFNRVLFQRVIETLCLKDFIRHDEIAKRAFQKFRGHFGAKECVVLQRKH